MLRYLTCVSALLVSSLWCDAESVRRWIDSRILSDTCVVADVPGAYNRLTVEVNGSMKDLKDCAGRNAQSWGLSFETTAGCSHDITVGWGNDNKGDVDDRRYLCIEGVETTPVKFYKDVNVYGGDNTLIIDVDDKGVAAVYIGDDKMTYVGSIILPGDVERINLRVSGTMDLDMMCVESEVSPCLDSGLSHEEILARTSRVYGPIGVWSYLDRDNDADYARPGGTYSLAIIPGTVTGEYVILYMDGAGVNRSQWQEGMIKGRLRETQFAGRYDLLWYDAMMEKVDDEASATVSGDVITFFFPLHYSQLRYSRN